MAPRTNKICEFWLKNECKFGADCRNLHERRTLDRSRSRSKRHSHSRSRSRRPRNASTGPGTLWVGGLPDDCEERDLSELFDEFGTVDSVVLRSKPGKDGGKEYFAFVKCGRGMRMGDAVKELDQTRFRGTRIKVVNNNPGAEGGGGDRGDNRDRGDRGDRGDRNSRGGDKDFKPKRFEIRPGDWNCPKCSDLQFARNDKCRRCGEPKPTNHRGLDRSPDARENRGTDNKKEDKSRVYLEKLPLEISRDELKDVGLHYGKVLSTRLWEEDDCKHGILEYETEEEATKAIDDMDGRRMEDWPMILRARRMKS